MANSLTPRRKKVTFAHLSAIWSDDHLPTVKSIAGQADITNLRDLTLGFNVEKLTALVEASAAEPFR